jgi:hypothetical protein
MLQKKCSSRWDKGKVNKKLNKNTKRKNAHQDGAKVQ